MTYKKSELIQGRIDGNTTEVARFHQIIKYINLDSEKITLKNNQQGFAFIGSATDEGVRRNQGRLGAALAPQSIRQGMASFPVHFSDNIALFDCGNISDENGDLEKAQTEIGSYITKILEAGCTPILLGGGHDITYSNYLGIKSFLKNSQSNKKLGIINVDAHFDFRQIEKNI